MISSLKIITPKWALPLLKPTRYKAAYGGRGSGKSHFFAELAVEQSLLDPNWCLVAIREVQKSIQMSVKRLIESKIKNLNVEDHFIIQQDRILRRHGRGVFIFTGMNNQTADSIKSLEDFDCAWVEEAQRFSQKSLDLLRPTIRKEGSELWFSWNPSLPTDPVDKFFRSSFRPPNAIVVKCSYKDNPWFPEDLNKEIELDKDNDINAYEHIWLGAYHLTNVSRVVLPYSDLKMCVGAAKKIGYTPSKWVYMGLDVADGGVDKPAYAIRQGSFVHEAKELNDKNGYEIANSVIPIATNYRMARCHYDATGVGASIKSEFYRSSKFKRLPFTPDPFLFGGKVKGKDVIYAHGIKNADFFSRANAQGYWNLKLRLNNTKRLLAGENVNRERCFFLQEDASEELLLELNQVEYERDSSDRIKVIKTPEGRASPNLADAIMMSFARDLTYGLKAMQ